MTWVLQFDSHAPLFNQMPLYWFIGSFMPNARVSNAGRGDSYLGGYSLAVWGQRSAVTCDVTGEGTWDETVTHNL